MNDRVPKSLSEALRVYGFDRQTVCMVVSEELCGSVPRPAGRSSQTSYDHDAGIARLRKLRDHYRARNQTMKAEGVEAAIRVLREAA